jgi:hypothetical protein
MHTSLPSYRYFRDCQSRCERQQRPTAFRVARRAGYHCYSSTFPASCRHAFCASAAVTPGSRTANILQQRRPDSWVPTPTTVVCNKFPPSLTCLCMRRLYRRRLRDFTPRRRRTLSSETPHGNRSATCVRPHFTAARSSALSAPPTSLGRARASSLHHFHGARSPLAECCVPGCPTHLAICSVLGATSAGRLAASRSFTAASRSLVATASFGNTSVTARPKWSAMRFAYRSEIDCPDSSRRNVCSGTWISRASPRRLRPLLIRKMRSSLPVIGSPLTTSVRTTPRISNDA